ncbi:unnamed protein product [Cuscuta epithymum]|uniref:Uncharacterized protein n=1 Tax=Cuscuta epithymum TaxID=186058 RepID=A0AAV0E2A2_9ASTE|nr:unnamed protein product [Cuscuta epithymum]
MAATPVVATEAPSDSCSLGPSQGEGSHGLEFSSRDLERPLMAKLGKNQRLPSDLTLGSAARMKSSIKFVAAVAAASSLWWLHLTARDGPWTAHPCVIGSDKGIGAIHERHLREDERTGNFAATNVHALWPAGIWVRRLQLFSKSDLFFLL